MFTSYEQAKAQLERTSYPAVLKADGLAAGKGVIIAPRPRAAREALRDFFIDRRFGEAGRRVVLEECLEGTELSVLALCDGQAGAPMAPAQDYKRIVDGDEGPNTAGWELFPVPGIDPDDVADLAAASTSQWSRSFGERGSPYRGVLYAGLMMTADGPKGARVQLPLRRPETQAVLPRLRSDLWRRWRLRTRARGSSA